LVHLFVVLGQNLRQELLQRRRPFLAGLLVVVHAHQRQARRQQMRPRQIVERRDDQPFGQIAIGAEDHDGARRRRRLVGKHAHWSSSFALWTGMVLSIWPPNSLRMAESSFSPKLFSMRERKRA